MADTSKLKPAEDLYGEIGIDIPFGKGSGDGPSLRAGVQTWDSMDRGSTDDKDSPREVRGDPVGSALKRLRDRSAHGSGIFTDADIKQGYKLMPTMGG